MNIIFEPWLPQWALVAAALGGALFAGLSMWRNWKSGAFRALAVVSLVILLANPQWREAERTPLDDIVVVLVDESASQSLDNRDSVAKAAADNLSEKLEALGRTELRVTTYGGDEETRTVAALRGALADITARASWRRFHHNRRSGRRMPRTLRQSSALTRPCTSS